MSLSSKYGPSKMVRKCTKNSKKWMSQNGVVLAAIDGTLLCVRHYICNLTHFFVNLVNFTRRKIVAAGLENCCTVIECGIFGEGSHSHISTNQKLENCAFSLLIGRNMRPFPKKTVLYNYRKYSMHK